MNLRRFLRRRERPASGHAPGSARIEPATKVRFSVDPKYMRRSRPPGSRP